MSIGGGKKIDPELEGIVLLKEYNCAACHQDDVTQTELLLNTRLISRGPPAVSTQVSCGSSSPTRCIPAVARRCPMSCQRFQMTSADRLRMRSRTIGHAR